MKALIAIISIIFASTLALAQNSNQNTNSTTRTRTVVTKPTPTPKVIKTPTPINTPVPELMPQRAPMFRRHVNQPQVVAVNSPQSRTPRAVNQLERQPEQSLAPQQNVAQTNVTQQAIAASSSAEVARIELQTADPNIRIIWLAQQPTDVQPTKDK